MFTITPALAFNVGDTLTSSVANVWRTNISRSLDTVNGGVYGNSTKIEWSNGSAGWDWKNTTRWLSGGVLAIDNGGELDMLLGGVVTLQAGCAFTVGRDAEMAFLGVSGHPATLGMQAFSQILFASGAGAEFESGSNATWDSGSTLAVSSGVTFTMATTEQVNSGGKVQIESGATLQVDVGATSTNAAVTGTHYIGTQPLATDDPGADNIAIATNQVKAWANLTVGNAIFTINDGYNIAAVAAHSGSSSVDVTFARALVDNYAVVITGGQTDFMPIVAQSLLTTAGFNFSLQDTSNFPSSLSVGGGSPPRDVYIMVLGRQ